MQLTYSVTRFGIYETGKEHYLRSHPSQKVPLYQNMALAAVAGTIGGLVGTPADMVNVR